MLVYVERFPPGRAPCSWLVVHIKWYTDLLMNPADKLRRHAPRRRFLDCPAGLARPKWYGQIRRWQEPGYFPLRHASRSFRGNRQTDLCNGAVRVIGGARPGFGSYLHSQRHKVHHRPGIQRWPAVETEELTPGFSAMTGDQANGSCFPILCAHLLRRVDDELINLLDSLAPTRMESSSHRAVMEGSRRRSPPA